MGTRNKRPSKAEMKRLIAQEKERANAAAPVLPPEIAEHVESYVPRNITEDRWTEIRPFVLDVLRRYEPEGTEAARQRLVALVAYTAWAVEHGYALDIDVLLDHALIEGFARSCGASKTTAANYRSRLRGITNKVRGDRSIAHRPARVAKRSNKAPYSAAEVAAMVRIARTQPSHERRRRLSACVALGFGAGLDSRDLRHLHRRDIVDLGQDGIRIDVPGDRARRVWVRRSFEDLLRESIDGLAPGDLVLPGDTDRRNVAAKVFERSAIVGDAPRFEQSRMRNTWLVALLEAPIPLPVILDAAGITSARSLTELAPYANSTADVEAIRGEGDR